MNGQMLTRSILAWDLVGEATALAYVNLAVAVPMLFASLLGGAITDRIERRQIVIIGQSLLVVNELFVLTLLLLGKIQFWHLMCMGFVAGCALPFIMPARMAITASVVGRHRMQSAMAFASGAMNLSRVAGPAVMGIVIARYSIAAAYALASVLYLIAIACMFGVKTSRSSIVPMQKKALTTDIVQGLVYVKNNRPLLMCVVFGLLPMLLAMPFQNLLVMLTEQAWQKGESAVGTLIAVGGVGGAIGSLWIVRRGSTPHRLIFMVVSTLVFAVALGMFAQTSNYYIAMLPLLIANICVSSAQTVNSASVQILTDDDMRGRISSLMMMSFGLMPIGVFPMAIAADRFGAANSITGACVVLVILVCLFYMLSSTFRDLDRKVSEKLATVPAHSAVEPVVSKV